MAVIVVVAVALRMLAPAINFAQSPGETESQYGTGVNWPQEIRELFPFQLNVVRVIDGLVTFRAPGIKEEESMTAREVRVELLNLANVEGVENEAFASIDVDAKVMGKAPFKLSGSIDPTQQVPTFDIDFSLEGAQLVDINPWLREFVKGHALVGLAAKVFENRAQDQVATQVPLSGEFEDPKAGLLPAFVNLLRNAFVRAFTHSLEGTISLRDVSPGAACLETGKRRADRCE